MVVKRMQYFGTIPSRSKKLSQFAVGVTTIMLLSACGVEGLEGLGTATDGQTDNTEEPTFVAATPDNNSQNNTFTAQRLDDGSMLLDWPSDPAAIRYLVVIDGDVVAELPAATTSFVADASSGNLENSNIQILAQDASNTLTAWVNNPIILQASEQPGVGQPAPALPEVSSPQTEIETEKPGTCRGY